MTRDAKGRVTVEGLREALRDLPADSLLGLSTQDGICPLDQLSLVPGQVLPGQDGYAVVLVGSRG